jgi:hypothetical protein
MIAGLAHSRPISIGRESCRNITGRQISAEASLSGKSRVVATYVLLTRSEPPPATYATIPIPVSLLLLVRSQWIWHGRRVEMPDNLRLWLLATSQNCCHFCSLPRGWGEDLTVAVNLLRQKKRGVPQEFELSIVRLIGGDVTINASSCTTPPGACQRIHRPSDIESAESPAGRHWSRRPRSA